MRQFINPPGRQVLCAGEAAGQGAGSGAMVVTEMFFVIEVENGMATRMAAFNDREQALEAVGLRD